MDIITLLKQNMSLSEDALNPFQSDFKLIEAYIEEKGIHFIENYALGFYSHMYSFLKRLKENEKVEGVDPAIREDIEPEIFQMTFTLIEELSSRYKRAIDVSEVILAAIHIQTAVTLGRS